MHVHSLGDERVSPPLYLANGLTTVREMAASNPMLYDWRDRIDAGTLLGPRMVVASKIIDGDPTLWDPNLLHVMVVDDAAARAGRRTPGQGRGRRLRQGVLAPEHGRRTPRSSTRPARPG